MCGTIIAIQNLAKTVMRAVFSERYCLDKLVNANSTSTKVFKNFVLLFRAVFNKVLLDQKSYHFGQSQLLRREEIKLLY